MNKSIWHTPPEQPDPFKSWNILVVYEANDRKEMMYSTQFIHATDGMYVNRWCYLDDLLALETKLDRTRKALNVAVDALKEQQRWFGVIRVSLISHLNNENGTLFKSYDADPTVVNIKRANDILNRALEQITTLEQKE